MEKQKELWKRFFVILAGRTNGAHRSVVQKLKRMGQTETISAEQCDYLLVFCPVASRVGTDITEALDNIPSGKPVILVVMHHTFNPHHVVAESWRQVNNSNIYLTVDCLFHEDQLLICKLNKRMWGDIWTFFGVYNSQTSVWQNFLSFCLKKPLMLILLVFVVMMIVIHLSVSVKTNK